MRDPARIDRMLAQLRCYWHRYPDLRLGQLVYNAARDAAPNAVDSFHVEDDKVEERLREYNNRSEDGGPVENIADLLTANISALTADLKRAEARIAEVTKLAAERYDEAEACHALLGEPYQSGAVKALIRERDSAICGADRLRHGVGVEGDFVCPDSLALTESRATTARIAAAMNCEPADDCDLVEAVRLLVAERDRARMALSMVEQKLTVAVRERDEARALKVPASTEAVLMAQMAQCVAEVERDEARAALTATTETAAQLGRDLDAARGEVERMRWVIDAACAMLTLASNLAVAGALCEAWEIGRLRGPLTDPWVSKTRHNGAGQWSPGCGRRAV